MDCNCISSIANVVLAVIALVTLIKGVKGAHQALKQWKTSMKVNQSKAVYSMTHDLFNDENVCQMLYDIDHKKKDFDISTRDDEMTMDKIFVFFDHLCWMQDNELIELDNHVLLYWRNRLVQNEKVKSYWDSQKKLLVNKMPYNADSHRQVNPI